MRHDLLRHVALHRLVNNVLFDNSKSTNEEENDDDNAFRGDDGGHENKKIDCDTISCSKDNIRDDKQKKMKIMMTNEQLCVDKQMQYMTKDNVQAHDCIEIPVHTTKECPHQMHSFLDPIPLSLPHSECGAVYKNVINKHHLGKNSDINITKTCDINYEKSDAMENNLRKKDDTVIDSSDSCNLESCIQPSEHIIVHKIRCIDVAVQTDDAEKQINDDNTTNNEDSPNNSRRCDTNQSHNIKRETSTSTDDLCKGNAVVNAKNLRKKEVTCHKNRTCRNKFADEEEESRKELWELEESEQSETESEDEDDTTSDDDYIERMHRQQQRENHRKHFRSSNNDELENKKQQNKEKLEKCEEGVEHYKRAKDKA